MKIDKIEKHRLIEILRDLSPVEDHKKENLIIDCPFCGQRECSISLDRGHQWGCFRLKKCGERGNLWKILKVIGKLDLVFSSQRENSDIINLEKLFGKREESPPILDTSIPSLPSISKPFGWRRVMSDEYLNSRGFKSYEYCEVGRVDFEPGLKKDYVVFLVREDRDIKGYVGRHVWDKKRIEEYNAEYFRKTGRKNKIKRYKNSITQFSNLLYGYDEIDEKNIKPVCLVEGIFDKHAVDEKLKLHDNRFMYTCATFKAFVSDTQIIKLLVKGVKDVILFYDPDVIKQIQVNVQKLVRFFNVKVVISSIPKDCDEMSEEELVTQFTENIYSPDKVLSNFTYFNFKY